MRLIALVAAVLVGLLGPAPDAARAAEPGDARVVLSGAALEGADPDAAVVVTGQVTNVGSTPLQDVRVNLWRSTARLRSSDVLEAAIAADTPPTGSAEPVAEENTAVLTSGDALAPGATRPFTVRGRLSALGMTVTDTSYWVGAVVQARSSAEGLVAEAGADRTLVTVPAPGATAAVVDVVELSARPRLVRPGLFVDDGLGDELAGRLGALLEAAGRAEASWVVDPALLAEVRDMADGYTVVDGAGVRPGVAEGVAADWLAAFALLDRARGHAALFAQPDLSAADAAGAAALVGAARKVATDDAVVDLPTLVTQPAPDPGAVAAAAPLGAPVLATGAGTTAAWVSTGSVDVLAARQPAAPLDSPVLADTPLNRAAVLEARTRAAGSQVRLLSSAADVAAGDAVQPTWIQRRPLADLVATEPTPWEPGADGGTPMTPDLAARIAKLPGALTAYGAAAPASGVGELAEAQALRGASASWRGDADAQAAWLTTVEDRVGYPALSSGIALGISPRFSMSGTDSDFPVTVTNSLADAVTVTVVARTDNPQRIRFTPTDPVLVAAGASETIVLHAQARGSGVVNGQIHVEAPGALRLTEDVPVIVETTNFGTIGWVLVVASGVVLVISTGLRIRQVRARQGEGRLDG